jgi:hypothetical protein
MSDCVEFAPRNPSFTRPCRARVVQLLVARGCARPPRSLGGGRLEVLAATAGVKSMSVAISGVHSGCFTPGPAKMRNDMLCGAFSAAHEVGTHGGPQPGEVANTGMGCDDDEARRLV